MRKLAKNTYRGIEYIRLSSLPDSQVESLSRCLDHRSLIKLLQDEIILTDCVLYTVYEVWYDSFVLNQKEEPLFDMLNQPKAVLTSA